MSTSSRKAPVHLKTVKYTQKIEKQPKIKECLSTEESEEAIIDSKRPRHPRK